MKQVAGQERRLSEVLISAGIPRAFLGNASSRVNEQNQGERQEH